jgi:ketosteroid isomerase-like protein
VSSEASPFEDSVIELEQLIPAGDQVLALVRTRWRPRGSSSEIDIRIAHLWTFRDGKAARCQAFAEREKGFQAAGVPAASH